jgi:hypothetical protein
MPGRMFAIVRTSFSWKAFSIMPCCGRPASITSPVFWAIIPMQGSSNSSAAAAAIYAAFDSDPNGSGQSAAKSISRRLSTQGVSARRVCLPDGHDPNSFFVQGGDALQFKSLMESARP